MDNISFLAGDVLDLRNTLNGEVFDVVWAVALLHHLPAKDQPSLLQSVYDSLKPGGLFIAIDPSKHRLISLFKSLFSKQLRKFHSPDEDELDFSIVREQLLRAGFRVESIVPVDFYLNSLAWLYPDTNQIFVNPLGFLNRVLCAVPLLRRFSPSFCVVAQRER